MKKSLSILFFLFVFALAQAQEMPKANPKDVKSLDAIILALYDVISGPAGQERDWERMKSLFIPEGRLMPSGQNITTGKVAYRVWSVQDYIDEVGGNLVKDGFYEREIARKVEEYGTIAQVFSTYESRRKDEDVRPFARGINSIQLLKGKDRWYIVSVFWMGENAQYQLPAKYLGN